MALSEKTTESLELLGFLKGEIGPEYAILHRCDRGFPAAAVQEILRFFLV